MSSTEKITVAATVQAPVEKTWDYYTIPEHVTQWNYASDDWHSPKAVNDLRVGGSFSYRMEARDGSFGFDFGGVYDKVDAHRHIVYTMGDGRKVTVSFDPQGGGTHVSVTFEAENMNPLELQREGWQAILNNFKNYTENN